MTGAARTAPCVCGQETVLAGILALALLVLAFTSEQFFTVDNLLNQGRLVTEVGLVALPMTYIIITGGIDLSAGSTLGLCAIMLGVLWKNCRPAARAGDRPDAGDRHLSPGWSTA